MTGASLRLGRRKKGLNAILAELLLLIRVSQNLLKCGGDQDSQQL